MILAGSLEFEKGHNNEIQERPSDNVELPEVWPTFSSLFSQYDYTFKSCITVGAQLVYALVY